MTKINFIGKGWCGYFAAILLLCSMCLELFSQESPSFDSLKTALVNAKDSNKIKILNQIFRNFYGEGDFEKAMEYAMKMKSVSEGNNFKKGLADSYTCIGIVYKNTGDFEKAMENYLKALTINEETDDKHGIASSLGNIGNFESFKGNNNSASEYFRKSLKIFEELDDKPGIATCHWNLALVYYNSGDYDKALEHHFASLKIREELGDKTGMTEIYGNIGNILQDKKEYARALEFYKKELEMAMETGSKRSISNSHNNIGNLYADKGDSDNAIEHLKKALKIDIETQDKSGLASRYENLGGVYSDKKEYEKALEFFFRSLKLKEEMDDLSSMAISYINIGECYYKLKNYSVGVKYLNRGLQLARETEGKRTVAEAYRYLSDLYKNTGNYLLAYENYLLYSQTNDSVFTEESSRQMAEMQTKYESEKKQKEIELLNKKQELQHAELEKKEVEVKKQNLQKIAFATGFGFAMLLAFVVFRSFRQKQKMALALEEKNAIIEGKNKDITDSILYASRIQKAILPGNEEFQEIFPESFVLFKPRDIVSGDFFWTSKLPGGSYLLTADCTGHGVPGAFMSMIGSALFNEAVNEKNISEPHLVFNEVRNGLMNALKQKEKKEGTQKDGMDASLCRFFPDNGSIRVQCCCANNSLFIIRNNSLAENDVIEISADRFPVGVYVGEPRPFTLHQRDLNKGDTIYTFTDGYRDQFGGIKGKKFKHANLKKILFSIREKSMEEQKEILSETIEKWKGALEQVDDICIIGIRI